MKRLFALLLTLAMLLSSAALAEFDYTGLWTLTGAEVVGRPMDIAVLGLKASVLLKADGSCVLTMQDKTQSGTWAATRTGITTTDAEGVVDTYKLVNNSLVVEKIGLKLFFARGVEEEISYVGTWTLESVEVNGAAQEMSALGISASIVLNEDGSCVLLSQDETQNGTWAATETGITTTEAGGYVDTYTLVDGKLVVEVGIIRMTFARAAEKNHYVGSWALTSMQYAGMTLDSEMLKHFDAEISLIISEDGTCKMVSISDNETQAGTWKETEDGIVLTDTSGESQTFLLADGALVTTVTMMTDGELNTEQGDATMIFTPVEPVEDAAAEPVAEPTVEPVEEAAAEPVAEPTVEPVEEAVPEPVAEPTVEPVAEAVPEPVAEPTVEPETEPTTEPEMDPLAEEEYAVPLAGLTMADFNGEWVLADVEYMGQVMGAEMLGMSIEVRIQDGKGHMEMAAEGVTEVHDAVCKIEEIEELGTVMYFFYTDPATGEATKSGMMLWLYSDGELVWLLFDKEENEMFYNFEKVTNVSE